MNGWRVLGGVLDPGELLVRSCSTGVVAAFLAIVLSACGGSAKIGPPPVVSVATVSVTLALGSLGVGEATQATATLLDADGAVLEGRTVAWSSSEPTVAAVGSSGRITARAVGTTEIFAVSEGKLGSATLVVTVQPVARVTVVLPSNSLAVGQSVQASATLQDASAVVLANRAIAWTSSNASTATVSATGLVAAVGVGTATIKATSEGIEGAADLVVSAPVPGQAARMTAVSALDQTAAPGANVVQPPAVLVEDATGAPASGVSVSFGVAAGGGVVGGSPAVTGADGVARATSWTLGGEGAQSVRATAAALPGVSVEFAALARPATAGFDITLRFIGSMSDAQARAFVHAKERIEAIVVGDVPSVAVNFSAAMLTSCGGVAVQETVDDMLIFAEARPIDGAGKTLGTAGFCARRASGLPFLGYMQFDTADLDKLEASGTLESVILHEMIHVLGFGTLWVTKGLLDTTVSTDPFFDGASARSAFANLNGGVSYAGTPVPVESGGGSDTALSHWRESVLDTELMTGWISAGGAPLSATTIGSLQDIGYLVDLTRAEPYRLPTALRASLARSLATGSFIDDEGVFLGDHLRSEPPIVVDELGIPVGE